MKNLLFFCLTFGVLGFANAQKLIREVPLSQDTLYIYQNNQIIFKRAVNSIDSMTFKHVYTTVVGGKVSDVDGNEYDYVTINGVDWFVQNLKTTRLNDGGTDLTNVTNLENITSTSYAISGNATFYNFYAANSQNICPAGWNVPYTQDFHNLNNYAFNETNSLVGFSNQMNINFTASGYYTSLLLLNGSYAGYWTQEEASLTHGKHAYIYQGPLLVSESGTEKRNGLNIKCVRNGFNPNASKGDKGDGGLINNK